MQLFLHIGAHKTGTTSLQNAFHASRGRLSKAGLNYPASHDGRKGHHDLAVAIRSENSVDEIAAYYRKVLTSKDHSAGLLSSEEFEFFAKPHEFETLKETLSGFDTKILFWVRRQDKFLESEYSQHVTMEGTAYPGSLNDFFYRYDFRRRFNFVRITDLWSSHFGADNIRVRVYDRDILKNGSSIDDCLGAIGFGDQQIAMDQIETNHSLNGSALDLVRRLNEMNAPERVRRSVVGWLEKEPATGERQPLLSEKNRLDFMSYFRQSNSVLSRRYKLGHDWYR